jgi:hypothetical protein
MVKKMKHIYFPIFFLLIIILIFAIVLNLYTKEKIYKRETLQSLESLTLEELKYFESSHDIYITTSEEKSIIENALKNSTCILIEEGFSGLLMQYSLYIGDINIYYVRGKVAINDGSSYYFLLEEEDRQKVDNLIQKLTSRSE